MSKVAIEVRVQQAALPVSSPERVVKYSLLSPKRLGGIVRACQAAERVPGATAEIGCASGGTTRLIALLCGRRHWACDTFEGLVDAGARDPDLKNGDFSNGESTFAGVVERASDLSNVTVVQGRFPDCATAEMQEATYALVHLDTDTYESMRDGFAWFKDRIARGGFLVLDDVIGRGTAGGKQFWSEADKSGWSVVEQNDPQVVLRKL